MIYEQKITGMPRKHSVYVSIRLVLEQKEKLFLFTIGRMSKDMWHGKEISQEEYEQIQDFSDSDLAWFMQP